MEEDKEEFNYLMKKYISTKLSIIIVTTILKNYSNVNEYNEPILKDKFIKILREINVLLLFLSKEPCLNEIEYEKLSNIQIQYAKIVNELVQQNQSNYNRKAVQNFALVLLENFSHEIAEKLNRFSTTSKTSERSKEIELSQELIAFISKSALMKLDNKHDLPDILEKFVICEDLISANLHQITDNSSTLTNKNLIFEAPQTVSDSIEQVKHHNPPNDAVMKISKVSTNSKLSKAEVKLKDKINYSINFLFSNPKTATKEPLRTLSSKSDLSDPNEKKRENQVTEIEVESTDYQKSNFRIFGNYMSNKVDKKVIKNDEVNTRENYVHEMETELSDNDSKPYQDNWSFDALTILKELAFL